MLTINVHRSDKATKGMIAQSMMLIFGIVSFAVGIPIGLYVWQSLATSITPTEGWTAAANTSFATTQENIGAGFGLLSVTPILFIAIAFLSLLAGAFVFGKMRGA